MAQREPWAPRDHAANLCRDLDAMDVSPLLSVLLRASSGARWAATRMTQSEWHVACADGRHQRGTMADVVALMEGE